MTVKVYSQAQWGIRAGVNFTNVSFTKSNQNVAPKIKAGFHVGGNVDIPITDKIYIQPALLFSSKGYKDAEAVKLNATAYYLELPLNFVYKLQLGEGIILLGAGPYLGYGLGGRWSTPPNENNWPNIQPEWNGNLQFTDAAATDNYYRISPGAKFTYGKPLDFGANVLTGYEFAKKLSFQLNGQLGLINIAPKVDDNKTGDILKNIGFGISFGYKF
ncbi:porin family protein [Niabella aquatica]